METGAALECISFDYSGPVALCDRTLVNQAQNAATTASTTAGRYGAGASDIYSNVVPTLERYTTTPPGYQPLDLATMKTEAQSGAAATSGKIAQEAKLRAMRTGNAAGVGSEEVAGAEAGARVGGGAVQDILAQNAKLKEMQRQQAFGGLENIYGQNVSGELGAQEVVPKDISEATRAGWLQNLTGILGIAASRGM